MGDCIFEFCTKFCVNISMSDVFLYSMFDTVYSISFKGTHKKRCLPMFEKASFSISSFMVVKLFDS